MTYHRLTCPAFRSTSSDATCNCGGPPPIGEYFADLAKMLEQHPAPWRWDDYIKIAYDAGAKPIIGLPRNLEQGLVAAVNLAAGIRP